MISEEKAVDILMNNAGVTLLPGDAKTEDGFEACIGINYLGISAFLELQLNNRIVQVMLVVS